MPSSKNTVFSDNPSKKKSRVKLEYGTGDKARRTIKRLKHYPKEYQRRAGTAMYYRAKLHKYQTHNMKNAEKVYKHFLKTLKQSRISRTNNHKEY
jgi:hypothetical protein